MDKELIDAIETLTSSIDRLTAIHTDNFNVDTSHDDTISLKGKMTDLIKSNDELRQQVLWLNQAVNELTSAVKKKL